MIIKEEAKRKRQAIVEQRMTKPDLHYTRKPSESVENYADNIVCNRKKVVTLAYPAHAFEGLRVSELFIDGRLYAISSLADILPTVVWHVNVYMGDLMIALESDGLVPWIKRRNPHLDLDYSIYSGNIELECGNIVNSIAKAQWLLLFCGLELDRIALLIDPGSSADVIRLRKQRRSAILVKEQRAHEAEQRKIREQREREKVARAKARAEERASASVKLERWGKKAKKQPQHEINIASVMSMMSSTAGAAWNTYNNAPIIVSCGGVIGTRSEMLSGEDS